MELRHLRYFVAVAEERHITKAAQRLGIQQPPLSLQIRQLEEELGTALFKRTARGVDLTAPGAAFLEEARAILARVRQAAASIAEMADGRTGLLSLGVTTSAVLHPFVPELIRAFRAAYPEVALDMQENNAAALTEAVLSGEAAAALLRQPVDRGAGLAFLELGEETMVVAVPAADRPTPRPLRLADLAARRFILVRRPGAPGMYADLLLLCRQSGFEPAVAAEVPHMLTAVSLVAAGLGVAVLPASMADIGMRGVRYELLDEPSLRAPLTLAYAASAASPVLANLLVTARSLLRPRAAA